MFTAKGKKSNIGSVGAVVCLLIFAVSMLTVLLAGARIYGKLGAASTESFNTRTCAGYISSRVRSAQNFDSIDCESFGGADCLAFYEDIDGERYVTRVYCSDGWLCELFSDAEGSFEPADGQRLIEAEDLRAEKSDVLTVCVTDADGRNISLIFNGDSPAEASK